MIKRLNITVDENVVEEAKMYAKSQGRSLSGLIEGYLKSLISKQKEESEIDVAVESLWGSVKSIPKELEYKEVIQEAIIKKHLK